MLESTLPIFDGIASTYDAAFTHTATGALQRARVLHLAGARLPAPGTLPVLEMNCGTGEDACWLASLGHAVLSTDISPVMVYLTGEKASIRGHSGRITAQVLAWEALGSLPAGQQYACVWSNFGGINCVAPDRLAQIGAALYERLPAGGRMVLVYMPRFCPQETLYFLLKGRWTQAWRRLRRTAAAAQVGPAVQPTWYYSPRDVQRALGPGWKRVGAATVGFFLPPSYLDARIARYPRLLRLLNGLEKRLGGLLPAAWGDHSLLILEKI